MSFPASLLPWAMLRRSFAQSSSCKCSPSDLRTYEGTSCPAQAALERPCPECLTCHKIMCAWCVGVYQFEIFEGNGAVTVVFKKVKPGRQLLCDAARTPCSMQHTAHSTCARTTSAPKHALIPVRAQAERPRDRVRDGAERRETELPWPAPAPMPSLQHMWHAVRRSSSTCSCPAVSLIFGASMLLHAKARP